MSIKIFSSIRSSLLATLAERKFVLVLDKKNWFYHYWYSSFYPLRRSVWIANAATRTPNHALTENFPLFFRHYLPRKGDTVVDVGAGTGSELEILSTLVGEDGSVTAFEAHPETFLQASNTVRISRLSNVHLFNLAALDKNSTVTISDLGADTANSLLIPGTRKVEAIRLGDFLRKMSIKEINYLKMNIEGAEYLALIGLLENIKPKNLCISCHDFLGTDWGKTYQAVRELLQQQQYKVQPKVEVMGKPWESWYIFASLD